MSRTTDHYQATYENVVLNLLGTQYRSFLFDYVTHASKKGYIASFPSIDASDDATETALSSDTAHRQDYSDLSSPTLADYVGIMTPHMDVAKTNTLIMPDRIDWGHTFRDIDEVQENASDHGDVTKIGVGRMKTKRDKKILDALFASTQLRGRDDGTAAAVNFPAGQILNEADGVFDIQTISSIVKTFETNYNNEVMEDIVCVISPNAKKQLLDSKEVTDKDFVDSGEYFRTGKLPKVYGVSLVSHPLVDGYKGSYDDCFVAFTKPGIVYNTFNPLKVAMDTAITQKNQWILYLCEMAKAGRRDDKRVVQGTLGTLPT